MRVREVRRDDGEEARGVSNERWNEWGAERARVRGVLRVDGGGKVRGRALGARRGDRGEMVRGDSPEVMEARREGARSRCFREGYDGEHAFRGDGVDVGYWEDVHRGEVRVDAEIFHAGDAVVGRGGQGIMRESAGSYDGQSNACGIFTARDVDVGAKREYAIRSFSSSAEGGPRRRSPSPRRDWGESGEVAVDERLAW